MISNKKYLYVIQCGEFPYYKIGWAKHLGKRQLTIQAANPFPINVKIALETDGAQMLEAFLHYKYKSRWLRGEWYILSTQDLEELQDILETEHIATKWLKTQMDLGKDAIRNSV